MAGYIVMQVDTTIFDTFGVQNKAEIIALVGDIFKGDKAPQLQIQYSKNSISWNSNWEDGDRYLRTSVDGGNTWSDAIMFVADISGKADKVSGATSGNLASLDSNGNIADSGKKASDFVTALDLDNKVDKVIEATSGNIATLNSTGNILDSGMDFDKIKKLLFIDMWNKACGKFGTYNPESGFFELNGYTDIGYDEAMNIYNFWIKAPYPKTSSAGGYASGFFRSLNKNIIARTNIPFIGQWYVLLIDSLYYESPYEKICVNGNIISSIAVAFYGSSKLNTITSESGFVSVGYVSVAMTDSFIGCTSLTNVKLQSIKVNISFRDSPLLNKESILYMINNAANTTTITITLHATAYAMAKEDYEIQSALTAKGNINIASA